MNFKISVLNPDIRILSSNLAVKDSRESGVCRRKEEGGYAFAFTLLAVHGTLEINLPLRSYRSNTILLSSRMYLDEVSGISRRCLKPERSSGMPEAVCSSVTCDVSSMVCRFIHGYIPFWLSAKTKNPLN